MEQKQQKVARAFVVHLSFEAHDGNGGLRWREGAVD